jgi:hypothetical protein
MNRGRGVAWTLTLLCAVTAVTVVTAQDAETDRVAEAATVLQEILAAHDNGIPRAILADAGGDTELLAVARPLHRRQP